MGGKKIIRQILVDYVDNLGTIILEVAILPKEIIELLYIETLSYDTIVQPPNNRPPKERPSSLKQSRYIWNGSHKNKS